MIEARNQFSIVFRIAFGTVLAVLAFVGSGHSESAVNVSGEGQIAVQGYDPVAYFVDGRPEEGSPQIKYEWKGATWLFSSTAHRDAFAANPEGYAPQYGGYCAYAVAKGSTAAIDPAAWSVVDGKLYLNNSRLVRELWRVDTKGYIEAADRNWPKIQSGLTPLTGPSSRN